MEERSECLRRTSSSRRSRPPAEFVLDDGTVMKGSFFLNPQQRVLDILNDERAFLPFEDSEGTIIVIRKTTIRRIVPVEQEVEHAKPFPTSIGH